MKPRMRFIRAGLSTIIVVTVLLSCGGCTDQRCTCPAPQIYTFVTSWGEKGDGNGQFGRRPFGIAIDQVGSVYIADAESRRIQKFTQSGDFISAWAADGMAVAADADGNVYVGDNHPAI